MLEYKFGTDEEIDTRLKRKQEILDKFNDIDNTFLIGGTSGKESLKLDRLEEKELDNEKIELEAKESLKSYKLDGENAINEEYEDLDRKKTSEIDAVNKELESDTLNVKNSAVEAQKVATDNAINKGVARGSILASKVENIQNNELETLKNLKNDANSKISTLNTERELLATRKQNALERFDIAYAVKLNEKIGKITEEIEKYNLDVIKYNNTIEEKEKEFALDAEKKYQDALKTATSRNEDLLEFIKEYGSYALNFRVQEQKAKYLETYLDGLPKQEALEILVTDEGIKKHLGEDNYISLLQKIRGKGD